MPKQSKVNGNETIDLTELKAERVQITLPPRAGQKLRKMAEHLEMKSLSAVVQCALGFYEIALEEKLKGKEVRLAVRDRKGITEIVRVSNVGLD